MRKLIWHAAGYLTEEGSMRNNKNPEFTIKDKRNALSHFYRLFSAFTKSMRFHLVSRGKSVYVHKVGIFSKKRPYFVASQDFAAMLELS